jgi:hypothetical protein
MKGIAGMICFVMDPEKTASFYETPDFQFRKRDPEQISVFLNWFRTHFLLQDKPMRPGRVRYSSVLTPGTPC